MLEVPSDVPVDDSIASAFATLERSFLSRQSDAWDRAVEAATAACTDYGWSAS